MTTPLDTLIDTVRASDARLPGFTRDAILQRILDAEAEPRFVPATLPATSTRRPWRRYAAVGAIGLALAAAAALVITQLGTTADPEPVAVPAPPRIEPSVPPPDDIVRPRPPPDDQVGVSVPQPSPIVGTQAQIVPPFALAAYQLSGEKNIFPDDVTKDEISRSGKTRLMIPVKLCLDAAGRITEVKIVGNGSGFPAYDATIMAGIRTWTYRPYLLDGVAAPVCTIVQFVYNQR